MFHSHYDRVCARTPVTWGVVIFGVVLAPVVDGFMYVRGVQVWLRFCCCGAAVAGGSVWFHLVGVRGLKLCGHLVGYCAKRRCRFRFRSCGRSGQALCCREPAPGRHGPAPLYCRRFCRVRMLFCCARCDVCLLLCPIMRRFRSCMFSCGRRC